MRRMHDIGTFVFEKFELGLDIFELLIYLLPPHYEFLPVTEYCIIPLQTLPKVLLHPPLYCIFVLSQPFVDDFCNDIQRFVVHGSRKFAGHPRGPRLVCVLSLHHIHRPHQHVLLVNVSQHLLKGRKVQVAEADPNDLWILFGFWFCVHGVQERGPHFELSANVMLFQSHLGNFNHLALGVSEPLLDEKLDDVRELAQKVSLLVVRVLVGGFDLVHRAHDDGQQQIQQNEKHDGHVRPEHQKKGELRGRVQLVQGLRQSQIAELPYHEKQERLNGFLVGGQHFH
mmetsp:Transcript_27011/g.51457  ORF Transcript_27011/g.51457 Transcript_27011/m.51457 type:complete len:284 (+) Transcript_27011:362-1213(+)